MQNHLAKSGISFQNYTRLKGGYRKLISLFDHHFFKTRPYLRSLLFTFSFCLSDKLNYSCVTLLKQNTLPHLKQNPASSSDIIQFQGPHKPLEKCEYSLVILQNKNVPWWTLSCKFAASVVLCSSKFRLIEMLFFVCFCSSAIAI